jgi:hypothetical protein
MVDLGEKLKEFREKHAGTLALLETSAYAMPLSTAPVLAMLAFAPYDPMTAAGIGSMALYTIPFAAQESIMKKWDIERKAKEKEKEVV